MNFLLNKLEMLIPNAFLVIFLLSSAVLGTAYIFQFGFGYAPCELCYYQRYPYMAIIAISGIGVMAQKNLIKLGRPTIIFLLILCCILLVLEAGIAAYHAGIEYKWWQGATACTANVSFSGSVEDRLAQLMSVPVIRCDEAQWSLFGISMAGYNFFSATIIAVFAIVSLSVYKNKRLDK